ncbi:DUF6673 family protein [Clostridium culturomicium]|uniref:DUF6673 family protein n=1 Tax=Clostridium culturomicium TaxID=1499683 RepID=UPI003857488F
MNINGIEFKLDLTNEEKRTHYIKCVKAFLTCYDNSKKIRKEEQYHYLFESMILFIDYVFGEGSSKNIFGETAKFEQVYGVANQIVEEANKQIVSKVMSIN